MYSNFEFKILNQNCFADLNTILMQFDLGGKSLNRKVFKHYNDILFNINLYIIY